MQGFHYTQHDEIDDQVPVHFNKFVKWTYFAVFGFVNVATIKPVYSVHLRLLKKVSTITRCPVYRIFQVIFTGSVFCEFPVFWPILRKLISAKIIVEVLIRKIREM